MDSEVNSQNAEWLKQIRYQIHNLDETLSQKSLIDIVIKVHSKQQENENLPYEQQIPYKVFKKLVELLLEKSEYLVSEDLLNKFNRLPSNRVIIQPLIEQQEILLFNHYNELLDENPNAVDILFKRAIYYFNNDESESSLIDINKLIEIEPNNQEAIYHRIKLKLKQTNYIEAYQEINQVLKISPSNEFALFERALLYLKFNYSDLAFADIRKLKKSNNIEYLLLCAIEYLENDCVEEVISICQCILNQSSEQLDTLIILGKAYFQIQEYEKSIATFELALKIIAQQKYLQSIHNKKLDVMQYISHIKCALNNYIDGLNGYLEVMALGVTNYSILRNYIKISEELLNKRIKEIDKKYLNLIANELGNLDLIAEYTNILCSLNDERGKFIKYENNLDITPKTESLRLNKSEFLDKVKHFWIEPNMLAEFEKGFPWKVTITNTQDIPYIERLPWIYTVRRLEIIELAYDNSEAISTLFEQNLPALRELKVQAEYFGYLCTKKLVKSPFFGNLESLVLTQCDLDAPSLKLIVKNLPQHIKELRLLYGNSKDKLPVDDGLGKFFTLSDKLQKLEILDLTDCSLTKDDVEDILSLNLPSLKKLSLAANDLSQLAPDVFLNYPLILNIEEMEVGETGIEKDILFKVLENFNKFNLKRINVQGDWTTEEITAIRQHKNFNEIEEINFGYIQNIEENWIEIFD